MSFELRASLRKSPGDRYISKNTSALMPSISGTIENMRLAMNFNIFLAIFRIPFVELVDIPYYRAYRRHADIFPFLGDS